MIRRILLALTLTAPLAIVACSQGGDSEISVEEPYARQTIGLGTTGAAYMVIRNTGSGDDRLMAASSPNATSVEMHTHEKDGDVMRMRMIDGIDIPAGDVVTLQPGGLHLMLFEVMEGLQVDATVPMTLTFEKAGEISTMVSVVATGGGAPADHGEMDHGAMDHGGMDHTGQ